MLWIDSRGLARWLARREKKRGRPQVYSPDAIRITLTLEAVYRLSRRRAVGGSRAGYSRSPGMICPCRAGVRSRAGAFVTTFNCRASVWALADSGMDARVPPCVDAGYWPVSQSGATAWNEAMIACDTPGGRAEWKQDTGYHVRSLAETAMSHSKQLLGDRLTARSDPGRECEHTLRAWILNQVTRLGRLTSPP